MASDDTRRVVVIDGTGIMPAIPGERAGLTLRATAEIIDAYDAAPGVGELRQRIAEASFAGRHTWNGSDYDVADAVLRVLLGEGDS